MSKRKLGTAEPELNRDRRQRVKKQKTSHEEKFGVDEPRDAPSETSQINGASEKPVTGGEAGKNARKRARKKLKKAQGEGKTREKSLREQDEAENAEEMAGSELQKRDRSKEESNRKKRTEMKKARKEEALKDRPQGQDEVEIRDKLAGTEPIVKNRPEKKKRKEQKKQRGKGWHAQDGMCDGDKTADVELVERTKPKEDWGKEQRKALKRARKEEQAPGKGPQEPVQNGSKNQLAGEELVEKDKSRKQRHKEKRKHKNKGKDLETLNEGPAWKLSDPIGGHMLDLDPRFSQDEKYLLVAYSAAVAVYSTSTSLLIRQLRIKKADSISGFAFSSENPSHIYISTVSGTIERWDWVEGTRTGHWTLSSSIYSLVTSTRGPEESTSDLVYTVDRKDRDPWLISAHHLAGGEDTAKSDVATLLKYEEPISSVKVLEGGRVIVATSESQLILGYCKDLDMPKLRDISYVWRVVECPEWVAGFDVRIRHRMSQNQAEKKGMVSEAVDIAVGGLKGSIHIYEDLLNKVILNERPTSKDSSKDITSRRLHWHRNSVLTIKWSLDGNYLISGGQETTLVLWQLETGQKQNLPHLGAPIESIVVSPSGSSYSVRLADNSAMILSTSELKPTFSTTGIQTPSAIQSNKVELPFMPTVDAPVQNMKAAQRLHHPACISSGHLLLAVPPSVTSRQASTIPQNSSYLQTFDIGGGQHLSRQALTRTKVTDLNMGPESNTIEEPNITHIQASADGHWLATADEWMPPKRDIAPLAFNQKRVVEEQIFRQEVYLKFWSWKDETKTWELVSRIDNPHSSQTGNPYDQGRVLELASDPSTSAFATIGEDGIVKTWRPAIRRRHGLEVRNKDGISLMTWHCKHTVPLESAEPITQKSAQGAKLAYSQDGSVLAAGLQSSKLSLIYLIDAYSGEIRSVQTGLYSGPLLGLGIINKYLITLAHEICVWDLVTDERQYGIHLKSHGLSLDKQLGVTHLAVDSQNSLFAIAVPELGQGANATTTLKSQIAIFNPMDASPLFLTSLRNTITNLLPATRRKGFYAIDSAAEVRTLTTTQTGHSLSMTLLEDEKTTSRGLNDIFGDGQSMRVLEHGAGKHAGLLTSMFDHVTREPKVQKEDAVVVSSDRLAEVFDVGPAYALPPVTELFEQVASLYNGRVR